MIGLEGKTLHSARLNYKLLEDCHKSALAEILSSPAIAEPAGFRIAQNSAQFDEFYAGLTSVHTGVGIFLGDTLIGYIHVNKEKSGDPVLKNLPCVSVGFAIGKQWQRRGFGAEMLEEITAYLLTRFAACYADCFVENEASRRTIEKCGYHYVEDYSFFFNGLGEEKVCHSYLRVAPDTPAK